MYESEFREVNSNGFIVRQMKPKSVSRNNIKLGMVEYDENSSASKSSSRS